ncbi:MAG: hypothetical protein QM800_06405 [Paludibacter sp.]
MSDAKSGTQQWAELKVILQAKLDEFYGQLAQAHSAADQTFTDRLKRLNNPTLVGRLQDCQKSLAINYRLSQKHRQFCVDKIAESDRVLSDSVAATQQAATTAGLPAVSDTAETLFAAQLAAGTSRIVVDALCLCATLAALLGHKEAVAFVAGAKQELLGAIFDPGAGVGTLLKRLYAVASRTLRADQDANELLNSLDAFEELMTKWRDINVAMSQGVTFPDALHNAFAELLRKLEANAAPR